MNVVAISAQLRTTDLDASIRFYTEILGFTLAFRYGDFYAGIRAGSALIHLKLVDDHDPSIAFVSAGDHLHLYIEIDDAAATAELFIARGVVLTRGVARTDWGTIEFGLVDDQGHTLYFGQSAVFA